MSRIKGAAMIAAMGAVLAISGTAQAQGWGAPGGYGRPVQVDWQDRERDQDRGRADWICSGQRARQLEGRLRHEVGEGDIDPDTAGRMHEAIDGLEQRQRQECDEGDWRSISRIADRFDRIEGWMNAEARRSHWRGW